MGNIIDRGFSMVSSLSFPRSRSTDEDSNSVYTYAYPSKDGLPYFSSHFIMGGKRFDSFQPESFLFGENIDLNFLGSKPTSFPYHDHSSAEPMRSLQSQVHIRKESIRFVRVTDHSLWPKESQDKTEAETKPDKDSKSKSVSPAPPSKKQDKGKNSQTTESNSKDPAEKFYYNIEFTFDSDVACCVSIYYFCVEEVTPTAVIYHPKDWSICHEKIFFPRGAGQVYCQPGHVFCPNDFTDSDLMYRFFDESGFFDPKAPFPLVVQVTALEGDDPRQSHSLISAIERNSNSGSFTIKPFVQKMFIEGLSYLVQEIYGIENKATSDVSVDNQEDVSKENNQNEGNHAMQRYMSPEEEMEESSASECVVCLSDSRDTLILPCRHLCLCNACADSLRYQANNCPICRAPFRALLQIQAVRRTNLNGQSNMSTLMTPASLPSSSSGNLVVGLPVLEPVNIPVGYESLPLVEALNGPYLSCSGSWSSNRHALPPDIERTPISVRRSHRSHRSQFQGNSHQVNLQRMHPSFPRRIPSVGHGDSVLVSEDIPLPSRRLTSSQSVRSASPSNIVMTPASCHPMIGGHFPVSSSSLMSTKTPPLTFSHIVMHGAEVPAVIRRESPKTEEPPEPAPLDWKVQSSRIHRKGSDPEDLEESSSSTSSSVVPQETTRLLPSGDTDGLEMMNLRSNHRSPSFGRKSPNRAKSSFSSITSSPKNRHRDLSLSCSAQAMLSSPVSPPVSSNIVVNPCSDEDDIVSTSSVSVVISKNVSDDDSVDDQDKE